jgi:hypothetical protein
MREKKYEIILDNILKEVQLLKEFKDRNPEASRVSYIDTSLKRLMNIISETIKYQTLKEVYDNVKEKDNE